MQIENAWYRISAKALIFNEKGQILLCKEDTGKWEFPGGGIDHGENHKSCLEREMKEETGLIVTFIGDTPEHLFTFHLPTNKHPWRANAYYKVEVQNLDFVPSDECLEIGFFDAISVKDVPTCTDVGIFFDTYKSNNK